MKGLREIMKTRNVAAMPAALTALACLVSGPTGVHAQTRDGWQFEATPYLWAAGMKGDMGIGKLEANGIEQSFTDIAKSIRVGFMGAIEGHKDRFGFIADAIAMTLHQKEPAPHGFLGDVDAKTTQQMYALAATWRVSDGATPIDLVGGVRSNYIKLDLDLSASALAPQGRFLVRSRTWVDGFVGARFRHPLSPQWSVSGYADIGGGGSDSTWQFLAGVNYAISPDKTVRVGDSLMKVDYHRDDFLYDVSTGGPYVGVGMRF